MRNKVEMITTTDTFEGFKITKYFGICTERLVIGAGLFSEFFAGLTDVFGGRSGAFEKQLSILYEDAMEKLKTTAGKTGANALVGVKIDIDEISGKNTMMFMITVSGTAVSIVSNGDTLETLNTDEQKTISGITMKNEIFIQSKMSEIKKCTTVREVFDKLSSFPSEFQLPLDFMLDQCKKNDLSFVDSDFDAHIINYFDSFDSDELSLKLYCLINNDYQNHVLLSKIIKTRLNPDYALALEKLNELTSLELFTTLVGPSLLCYKNSYTFEDTQDMKKLCENLTALVDKVIVVKSKGLFNKDIWTCSCGKKNEANDALTDICSGCLKGTNGILGNVNIKINKIINHLRNTSSYLEAKFNEDAI